LAPKSGEQDDQAERRSGPGDGFVQLAIGEATLTARFVPEDQRLTVVPEAQQVLGEVELGSGEPARAERLIGWCHPLEPYRDLVPRRPARPLLGHDTAEGPHLRPERVRPSDGPPVQ
jgi:hypothetical protein